MKKESDQLNHRGEHWSNRFRLIIIFNPNWPNEFGLGWGSLFLKDELEPIQINSNMLVWVGVGRVDYSISIFFLFSSSLILNNQGIIYGKKYLVLFLCQDETECVVGRRDEDLSSERLRSRADRSAMQDGDWREVQWRLEFGYLERSGENQSVENKEVRCEDKTKCSGRRRRDELTKCVRRYDEESKVRRRWDDQNYMH